MTRPYLRPAAAGSFVVLCFLLGVWAVVRDRDRVAAAASQLSANHIAGSFVLATLGMCAMLQSWRWAVRACGIDLLPRHAWTIYSVAQITKYVPGGVWPILSQTALGRRVGASSAAMSAAGAVHLALTVCVALVVGAVSAPAALANGGSVAWAPAVAVLLVLALWPPVLNRLLALGTTVLHRLGSSMTLPDVAARPLATAVVWCLLANGLFALHLRVLLPQAGSGWTHGLVPALAGYALASAAGVLVVLAPAGVGAREAVMTLVLAAQFSLPEAIVAVVMSRAVLVAVDILLALSSVSALKKLPKVPTRPTEHHPHEPEEA